MDAVLHYVIDHLDADALTMRVRVDNRASLAPLERMGFVPDGHLPMGAQTYVVFRIDREAWARRKTRLAKSGEPFA
jgi:RimJ/RimL family protein N-acetyltransferase